MPPGIVVHRTRVKMLHPLPQSISDALRRDVALSLCSFCNQTPSRFGVHHKSWTDALFGTEYMLLHGPHDDRRLSRLVCLPMSSNRQSRLYCHVSPTAYNYFRTILVLLILFRGCSRLDVTCPRVQYLCMMHGRCCEVSPKTLHLRMLYRKTDNDGWQSIVRLYLLV